MHTQKTGLYHSEEWSDKESRFPRVYREANRESPRTALRENDMLGFCLQTLAREVYRFNVVLGKNLGILRSCVACSKA